MKRLMSLIAISSLGLSAPSFTMDEGTADKYIQKQIEDCNKNTAKEWNSSLNRCVGKVEARATRNEAKECNAIADIEQRKACHLDLAQKNTGLNADPNSLNQGNIGKSAIMNGVGSAYAILGFINGMGESGKESTCSSKKIFGYTALAGTVTDIWLKIRSKKKMNSLAEKYQLDKTQSPYEAQVRALYYLKEEQQTVADIASAEKKRNLLLTLGYGAASAMAIFEIATSSTGGSTHCWQREPKTQPTTSPADAIRPNTEVEQQRLLEANADIQGEAVVAAPAPAPAPAPVAQAEPTASAPEPTAATPATAPPEVAIKPMSELERQRLLEANADIASPEFEDIKATSQKGVVKMKVNGNAILVDRVLDSEGNVIGILNTKSPPPTIDYSGPPPRTVIIENVFMPGKATPVLMAPSGVGAGKSMNNVGLDYTGNGGNKFLNGSTNVQYTRDGSNNVNVRTNTGTGTFKPSTPTITLPPKKK